MKHPMPASIVLAAFVAGNAWAQFPSGGGVPGGMMGGPGGRGGKPPSDSREAGRTPPATDAVQALERELPSLRDDLFITREQLPLWAAFERDVRDIAQIARMRERQSYAGRGVAAPGDPPAAGPGGPPDALATLQRLAEDDRARADAMNDLVAHFKALYASFSEGQRSRFEQRFALALRDPLRL
jgi:hypothetical protein